jgi:glycosyltransferase involved in cell wall biosynthesis
MLMNWGLNNKICKKWLAWRLYQRKNIETAQVLHATSDKEAEDLRNLRIRQPVAVIPNGIDMPPWKERIAGRRTPSTALFLGRIHPVKGLLSLVSAWAVVKPKGWRVVISGPDKNGHRTEVEAAIREKGLATEFSFTGEVDDKAKWDIYRNADLFILPSLSCEVPVITTKGAPWELLIKNRCGWWIDIGVRPLADALHEAINLSDKARIEMGRRGRQLVEERFSWSKIGEEMHRVYEWILGGGPPPGCVVTD